MFRANRLALLVFSALLVTGFQSVYAKAEEIVASGTITYSVAPVSKTPLKNERVLERNQLKGTVIASDPKVPIHLNEQNCAVTSITAVGILADGVGFCDGVDDDGDVWWMWYVYADKNRIWNFVGGTGKFEDIKGGGTLTILSPLSDGNLKISWQGKWKMK